METLLEVKNIKKSFGDNVVLENIDMSILKGEIHALVGENGAGKSTLMNIICGVLSKDEGTICLEGKAVDVQNPLQASDYGISIIHQEFNLIPHLSVAENIYLGKQPLRTKHFIDSKKIHQSVRELSKRLEVDIRPDTLVKELSVAQQQMVEIMKALSVDAKLIIMDEPTAALTPQEVKFLFDIVQSLKAQNKSIIFITHRINEIMEISDRITVLKDGHMVSTVNTGEISRDDIVNMMVGRKVDSIFPAFEKDKCGETVLEVDGLVVKKGKQGASFAVRKGEIVSIAGLEGQGQREVIRAIFGLETILSGTVKLHGKELRIRSTKDAVQNKIAFLSDDRKQECLCLGLPIYNNICLPILKKISKKGLFVTANEERKLSKEMVKQLRIKTTSLDLEVQSLSGGNQQKVALARCLVAKPGLLIIHEPTRGIDVNAKMEIYRLLRELADSGVAILMVSSDLLETIHTSNRILVCYDHHIIGEVDPESATEEGIINLAVGNKAQTKTAG
ncbi:sugar ABC transporter ATP-binding protein [Christensenella timonensis]|uniref:sugar ABC transporter ATP-binding protein n=1 Tax=Christensenella timonensis TaxID=1816678 RepID=UPI0008314696|nr:sugar ABC transporter ATP-binding protein [Christensenella timonensis]